MKKGFTLIELLGVIIILGVLILIIFPATLKQISNAKKGINDATDMLIIDAAKDYYEDNKENYKKRIGAIYCININKLVENNYLNLKLKDENLNDIDTTKRVRLTYNNNNFDYEVVDKCTGIKVVPKEKIPEHVGEENANGYTGVEAIVYLDPTNLLTVCDETKAVSTNGTKTGCMKFYAIEALSDDKTYTMILDHNTSKTNSEWISQDDYEQTDNRTTTPSGVGISYGVTVGTDGLPEGTWGSHGANNRGPITVLKQLYNDTQYWVGTEPISKNYKATWTCINSCILYSKEKEQQYAINYSNYKARLIEVEEIAQITGADKGINWTKNQDYFYFGGSGSNWLTESTEKPNPYGWLFDNTNNCEIYGCNVEQSGAVGYWTASPYGSYADLAWGVYNLGRLSHYQAGIKGVNGVRPVINVSKSSF